MPHFPMDASRPRRTADVGRAHGHAATDVRDLGLGTAADSVIAAHAQANQLAMATVDLDFANVIHDPPADYARIVVIRPRSTPPARLSWRWWSNSCKPRT